jgi:hypothetical protein
VKAGRGEQYLLLWDIDGTLLEANDFRHMMYSRLFVELLEIPFKKVISAPGFSTLEKIRRTLLFHDVTPTDRLIKLFSDGLVRGYVESQEELLKDGRLLPGATSALRSFAMDGRFSRARSGESRAPRSRRSACHPCSTCRSAPTAMTRSGGSSCRMSPVAAVGN